MMALDTNVLVYAHRRESQYHEQASDLVKMLAEGKPSWSIPWPCIYEFYSVVTNPRIWKTEATPPKIASAQITAWIDAPSLQVLAETQDFSDILLPIIAQPRIRGPIVHDARIAALCLAHGVEELVTKDRDFQLFPQLKTSDPFRPNHK